MEIRRLFARCVDALCASSIAALVNSAPDAIGLIWSPLTRPHCISRPIRYRASFSPTVRLETLDQGRSHCSQPNASG